MRKIIFNLALSLDSKIEGPNGEFDWCFTDQDYGMKEFLSATDTILFGRKSWEVLVAYDSNPYPDKEKIVFSTSTPERPDIRVVRENIAEEVRRIKQQEGGDIWLFGGAQLNALLLEHRLIDEMLIALHPVILGSGKPLFEELNHRVRLELLESIPYSSGLVQLRYRVGE